MDKIERRAATEGEAIRTASSYRIRKPTRKSRSRGHGKRHLPQDYGASLDGKVRKQKREEYVGRLLTSDDELKAAVRQLLGF
jgi:hypothetical protein